MNKSFSVPDSQSLHDLQVFLLRASRVDDGAVRLVAAGGVLAAYVAILYPRGLMDSAATVLGLRTCEITESDALDVVVPVRAVLDRVARLALEIQDPDSPVQVAIPPQITTVSWAGVTPPRTGWVLLGEAPAGPFEQAARDGINAVAAAIPTGTGEQLVQKVRTEVWSEPVTGVAAELGLVPAGAAFAGISLGFIAPDEPVRLYEAGPWLRLSTSRGHILVRRRR
jgi:hypothetical protein